MFYDLASATWGPEEIAAINRVLADGRFTMGEHVRQFEEAFAARFGLKHAVMVNSGSSANLVGVAALFHKKERPLRRGDEVLVPAISWATTFHPLQQYGLRLRFLDVELDTLTMDVSQLEAARTSRTRMVVAVSILGNPAALDVIRAFCDRHSLYLFEDNCESMGATLHGRPCGTFGQVNTFSTFFSHHISTMEGGVLLTDDDELDYLARVIRSHGWARDLPGAADSQSPDGFFEAYRFVLPGYNVRPLEICGAVGLEQLKKLDGMLERRRANAARFVELFDGDERFIVQREHGCSSWFSFTLILNPSLGIDRARVMSALREADIGFRMITGGCFPRHEAIRFFDYDTVGELVNANLAHDHGFFVGNHPRDLTVEITRLREVLDRAAVSWQSEAAR
ncbi:MAG: DegT/DnrJ/EryC1/StrS family aminotransferase [SAR202 cluster bacterium]|jgi:CDP-6-deoxy-D-xylo-4-hexulose-3-dehydrase|nr:pyridoxamine 5-phosphate oxidase [Acidobacteriota bacterium]MDP6419915.1 DegT/DnrJ/EryC1/StrS family aminotransferase [SAR202 cluster bacterium]HAL46191.1 pyridoxamine 5-phosphate oxidase [Dehalococcoidia bacterium]MDP6663017.1 DegT/DnrJ/EryC1/StrS family aminotransferase [SAR202 cluster bacterium]MQG58418.1 DegT/DnrJ/EryC1/StrS family aminotransferase [SAR202 cluster bacterium]|tara:strand:+ start:12244 stop:13431 length:1188 start_codon:yes stop_codon:yes gene_type:complete